MNHAIYRLSLDMHCDSSGVTLHMKRRDTARQIQITLTDGGVPYPVPETCFALLTAKTAEGLLTPVECAIEASAILCPVAALTTATGEVACELRVYDRPEKDEAMLITSPRFTVCVAQPVQDGTEEEELLEPARNGLDALVSRGLDTIARAEATAEQLREARESGQFNGAQGEKGEPGPKGDPYGYNPPVRFDLTRNMLNVAGDMVLTDASTGAVKPWQFTRQPKVTANANGLFTTLEQVHSLFDSLAEQYPHLWERLDAAEAVGLEYPLYAKGIAAGQNLFDRDRVSGRLKMDAANQNALPDDQVYIYDSWAVDLFTEEFGQNHRISEENLHKVLWLEEGEYTLSYQVVDGEGVLRVYGVNLTDYANGTYKLDQLTLQTVANADKKLGGKRLYHSFEIPEGGGYVTLIRTSSTATRIEKIQIEEGDVKASDYEPCGVIGYKYRLNQNDVCDAFLDADSSDGDLISWRYKPTPAYNTYLYKFSFVNKTMSNGTTAAGKPAANAKKKLLLVSGLHGDEKASPFNAYLFAKRLCELCEEDDYYRFAQAFDVYFLPCANGYGMYHNTRHNARGVDINRNFDSGYWAPPSAEDPGVRPTPGWTYPGPHGASEFETQLLKAVVNKIEPDMVCDHHTYVKSDLQFYSGVARREWAPLMYQSCTDCSIAFKRKYPEYFGAQIELVVGADKDHFTYGDMKDGQFPTWLRLKSNVYFPVAIEVCQCINYRDGVYVGAEAGIDPFGADTFSVAEYTLRNQLMRYGQFVMENKA